MTSHSVKWERLGAQLLSISAFLGVTVGFIAFGVGTVILNTSLLSLLWSAFVWLDTAEWSWVTGVDALRFLDVDITGLYITESMKGAALLLLWTLELPFLISGIVLGLIAAGIASIFLGFASALSGDDFNFLR